MATPPLDSVISEAALKPEQRSYKKIVGGNDVFVSLPTGYGKSLCYIRLPRFFYFVRGAKNKSIVVVVSPTSSMTKIE